VDVTLPAVDNMAGDRYRFIIGGILVLGLLTLAFTFGHGTVEEKTSFGLGQILTILSLVAYEFAKWAYPRIEDKVKKPSDRKDDEEKDGKA